MAVGDAAAAAGLEVVPSTQDWRLGYIRINQKGDELAAEKIARVAADATLTTAVATKVDSSRIHIGASQPATIPGVSGRIWHQPV